MSGAMKGAMIGMVLFEKWAETPEAAEKLLSSESSEIQFDSAHPHNACGPLAGTITANCPVWVVSNKTFGNVAFARPAEPHQGFGHYSVLDKLRHFSDHVAPALSRGISRFRGGLHLNPSIQRALELGDDFHIRNMGLSLSILSEVAVGMMGCEEGALGRKEMEEVFKFFDPSFWVQFYGPAACVGLSMATAKCVMDAARGVNFSSLVTCMSRNGTYWGMNVSSLGNLWLTAPAPYPTVNYLPGFSVHNLGADMGGDSSVCEAFGFGAAVLAGAPALMRRMPHDMKLSDAYKIHEDLEAITTTLNPNYQVPALDFKGVPTGIDIIKVVKTGITPWHVCGAVHKEKNHRIIGQGVSRAPIEAFHQALDAFCEKHNVSREDVLE
eukprot:TRINITY_DN6278_c0_g1_i9.p1 TRINITY_DN6278_c0_g1~~TRINITY_DN6278_c0_g1_i9.p1  ORF type:complete len:382 (+),score=83.80 TRINITY_DN6278_c0_g1_i9:349-1494(+)